MSRTKIDYGIDLGTTNSAIARIENGEPTIKKTDYQHDTLPSCVGFNKKKSIHVGESAWHMLKSDKLRAMKDWEVTGYNTFIEFKRTMGTDKKYYSSNMDRSFNSEEISSEVLKKLRSFITDEPVDSVIVTVPAKFDIRQKDATLRAAKLAGFKHCELLQEPIAASMAYGLGSSIKNGFWIVFDFGGGTFDVALVKVEDGIMKVIDTDGDNYLGGKNIDIAIVEKIIIPFLEENYSIDSIINDDSKRQILVEAMKYYAEEAKIQLSFNTEFNVLSDLGDIPGTDDNGEEFELDITITRNKLREVISPIYQKAINISKELLMRNNLDGSKLDSVILVGGPTYSPILRELITNQIKEPDVSVDPMTVVARGASLYASTIDVSNEIKELNKDISKVQLDIGYESSTVELEEWVTIKSISKSEKNYNSLFVEIIRSDKAWSSGKVEINETGEIVEVKLIENKPNVFIIDLFDESGNRLESQPDEFTIIQGTKVGKATLGYNIGIQIKRRRDGKPIFQSIDGLRLNQPLPAKGTINGLKTQKQIRPGISEDFIKIPIFQGEYDSEDTKAIYNEHVYDAIISGDDLPSLLPENSDVDLTLTTDNSGRIEKIEAYFPYLDYTTPISIPEYLAEEVHESFLESEIRIAKNNLNKLRRNNHIDETEIDNVEEEIKRLDEQLQHSKRDDDQKREILNNLRKSQRKIDKWEDSTEWPVLEKEIKEEFNLLERANQDFGDAQTTNVVNELRNKLDSVIRSKDVKHGQILLEEVRGLYVSLTFIYQLINFVRYNDENFDSIQWKDSAFARKLIEQAKREINNNPTKERLHPIVIDLLRLLPEDQISPDYSELLAR